ncbi:hypothetical protein PHJA_000090900 [Phtheirospermum japonicum]|uniref:Uncharacterized protein n=1 Tax=Phtheirospermum japonicum TaxID=374723 RepID=A0A830B4L5_9LAMI|nr:hypothetical protein PHJA_000090900 [Phtheirospermum japonicum]
MSIALERGNSAGGDHRIEPPGFAYRNMACASSIYNPPELSAVDRRFSAVQQPALEDQRGSLSSSSTSSIGENSDNSTSGAGGDGEEVQSECKGGPLDSLEVLEEVLPVNFCQKLCKIRHGYGTDTRMRVSNTPKYVSLIFLEMASNNQTQLEISKVNSTTCGGPVEFVAEAG